MARKPAAKPDSQPGPPVLQWLMSGLGLLLTLAVLVLILKEAFAPIEPAALTVRLENARPVADGWIAEVEVENTGDTTAAAVEIEGRLGAETAAISLDYVPAGGSETVLLGFSADPRSGLSLRTLGWSEP
ncbi:hypothetical protein ACIQC9_14235 [Brevundimonas sp. NPDC092305]|uniref:hypothetical protein n=1 Tax=Brevundimonas sp. NPDC092305 TaxID=3363957 RepID=UPI0038091DD7